ncbi:hypothetical protein MNEG_11023 [Monoraphidium neglectum]|uniref:SGNH hydrolase-type esterase domain-containing protein n=1 Tax=Monoraphidium neglectum TaxID=145388 RepID=A0A0D2LZW1_9CHLO|nr:hypothetical protein MNEG_11023 [Monoraphidium neglectum]KIY96939.1 hypothetical protein MNEG_11023 [Monoraphidium neglectum]|eukprot:XP_013895959.1 hypothetical protein MNEG_11023 [Monoraphidium neglectum]
MRAMLRLLGRLPGVECTVATEEAALNAAYYNVSDAQFGRQDCNGCTSFRSVCQGPSGRRVVIEFLRMEFVLDSELAAPMRIHWDNNCDFTQSPPCKWFWNSQQFLFEGYLKQRRLPPDHIHVFQNMHDCSRRSPADFRRDLSWFLDVLDTNLHPGTNVYFWEAPHPTGSKQPDQWRNVTSPACMRRMNDAVKRAVAPFLERTAAAAANASAREQAWWYATFDLFGPTGGRPDLSEDGVHMRGDWYETLARALVAGTCGSGPGWRGSRGGSQESGDATRLARRA